MADRFCWRWWNSEFDKKIARKILEIPKDHIPQMRDLSERIRRFNGMRLGPIETNYNYSFMQPRYFIIPSFEFLKKETARLIERFQNNKK